MILLTIVSLYIIATHFAWWMIPAIWFGWLLFGGIGTEIGLHRLYSHKAFSLKSKIMDRIVLVLSIFGGQGSPILWAAMHRGFHHPFTDTEKDLHSPVNGFWNAYMGWLFVNQLNTFSLRPAKHLLTNPWHCFVHRHYLKIFWASMAVLLLILGLKLFCVFIVLPIFLSMQQENITNLLCHINSPFSYRNFETSDKSTNIYLLGLLFWGQGFHNNHHAKPNLYDFGIKPREIDICRWIVPFLEWTDKKCY